MGWKSPVYQDPGPRSYSPICHTHTHTHLQVLFQYVVLHIIARGDLVKVATYADELKAEPGYLQVYS